MPVASGRSTIRAEIDLMEQSLKLMIDSVESYYQKIIDSLNSQIDGINQSDVSLEEKYDISKSYFNELEENESQRYHARNKVFIIIYSICETSLAGICKHYKIPLKHSSQNHSNGDYYLSDYLFSIGVDYTTNDIANPSYVVYSAIRLLRNYLTHCGTNKSLASRAVKSMEDMGFVDIINNNGDILIGNGNMLYDTLNRCNEMLLTSEQIAKNLTIQK